MSESELKEICQKDERSLEELVNALVERGGISPSASTWTFMPLWVAS